MNQFIKRHNLKYINVYLDNITVGGMDQNSHDENLKAYFCYRGFLHDGLSKPEIFPTREISY